MVGWMVGWAAVTVVEEPWGEGLAVVLVADCASAVGASVQERMSRRCHRT